VQYVYHVMASRLKVRNSVNAASWRHAIASQHVRGRLAPNGGWLQLQVRMAVRQVDVGARFPYLVAQSIARCLNYRATHMSMTDETYPSPCNVTPCILCRALSSLLSPTLWCSMQRQLLCPCTQCADSVNAPNRPDRYL
jgi:hypothetical protein